MGLRRQGWDCQLLPKGGRVAHLQSFQPLEDEPRKIWYVRPGDKNLRRDYLLCLSSPPEVWENFGVVAILHLRRPRYYSLLLTGKLELAQLALEGKHRPQQVRAIEDIGADQDSDRAQSEESAQRQTIEDLAPPGPATDDLTAFGSNGMLEVPSAAPEDPTAFEGDKKIATSGAILAGGASSSKSHQASDSGQSTESSCSNPSGSTSSQSSSTSSRSPVRRHVVSRTHNREQNGRWADSAGQGFRWSFTPKAPSPRGSYTVTCPYHHHGNKKCTRTRTWKTFEERALVVFQLMHWCNMATGPDITSKRAHMDQLIDTHTMPETDEIVEAARGNGFDVDSADETSWCPLGVLWGDEGDEAAPLLAATRIV